MNKTTPRGLRSSALPRPLAWRLRNHSRWFSVPSKAKKMFSRRPAFEPDPLSFPSYSPVLRGKRHAGAREGCAAQAACRAGRRRRRCPRSATGSRGYRGGGSGGGGAGSCRRGGQWIPSCCAARALCPSPDPLKRLLLLPLEGREMRGRGGDTRLGGREVRREGGERKRRVEGGEWGKRERITQSREEGGREARRSPSKIPTRRPRGGEIQEDMGLSPSPTSLPLFLPSRPFLGPFLPRLSPGLSGLGSSRGFCVLERLLSPRVGRDSSQRRWLEAPVRAHTADRSIAAAPGREPAGPCSLSFPFLVRL